MLKAGDVLVGRYTIVRPLGSGGFGSVFLATDTRLGDRNVAIKYFATTHMQPDEAAASAQLFQSEAHTLANLSHPNLTAVLDYFAVDDGWVLVMGYVPGESLAALQQRLNGPFGEEQVIDWAIELCNVLDFLHRQKPPLVFRDLKPSNIMRTPEGKLMLIDFGIVRSFKEGQHQDTVQLGTPGYAPPEQYGGQTEPRSDLYSLGATLYVLLTGRRVTGGFEVPAVREHAPWVSEQLEDLMRRLTALRPQERPASAAAVSVELARLKVAPVTPRPSAITPPARPGASSAAATQTPGPAAGQQAPHYGPGAGGVAAGPNEPTRVLSGDPPQPVEQPRPQSASPGQGAVIAQPRPGHVGQQPFIANPATPSTVVRPRSSVKWLPIVLIVLLLGGAGGAVYAFRDALFSGQAAPTPVVGTVEPEEIPLNLIVSTRNEANQGIFDLLYLPLDGSAPSKVIPAHADNVLAHRAPDGRLVYVHGAAQDGKLVEQIFTSNADGTGEQQITSGPGLSRAPRWSPDGRQIIFESTRDAQNPNQRDIYRIDADGSNLERVTTAEGWQGGPAWAPDSQQIVFHSRTNLDDLYQLKIRDLASGEESVLVEMPNSSFWPDWSPDGKTIAFMTEKGTTTAIYTVGVDGRDLTEITNLGLGTNRWPRWSPDGRYLAFESQRNAQWQVYVLSLADLSVRKVSDGTRNDRWPSW